METVKFDYRRLRGRIREVFGTETEFARKLGISRTSMSQRMNNVSEFSSAEILNASKLLKIPAEDIPDYFFTEKVQKLEP